jgi:predicted Zn-dependent protease/tetratricopeptide (TPR) repeat protein
MTPPVFAMCMVTAFGGGATSSLFHPPKDKPREVMMAPWAALSPSVADLLDVGGPEFYMPDFELLGLKSPPEIRSRLESSTTSLYQRLMLVQELQDDLGIRDVALAMFKRNALDARSAGTAIDAEVRLGQFKDAIALADQVLARRDDLPNSEAQFAVLYAVLPQRCEALLRLRKLELATPACREAGQNYQHHHPWFLNAIVLAKAHDLADAMAFVEKARQEFPPSGEVPLLAAAIANDTGRPADSRRELEDSLKRWPDFSPALRCQRGDRCGVEQVTDDIERWWTRFNANTLVRVSRRYRLMGMNTAVDARLEAAETLDPGAGLAERLAQQAVTDEPAAVADALSALKTMLHPNLFAIAAAGTIAKSPDEGRRLLKEGLTLDPGNLYLNELAAWDAARRKDRVAFLAAFARTMWVTGRFQPARIPTLSTSTSRIDDPFPRHVSEIVLVAYAEGPMPELLGLVETLSSRFPGVRFHLAESRSVPPRWVGRNGRQINGSLALEDDLAQGAIAVALVDRDMWLNKWKFAFGGLTDSTHQGMVSVSRLRHEDGSPTEPGDVPSGDDLRRSRARLQNQVTSVIGRLIGLSAPCENEERCVLWAAPDVHALDEKGGEFCAKHRAELRTLLDR